MVNEENPKVGGFPPTIDWPNDFPSGEISSECVGERILLIAMDSEFQSNYTAYTNLCLSFQYSSYDLSTGKFKSGIFYMDVNTKQRLTLGEFTHRVLNEMEIKPSSLNGFKIIYIAHFMTAEWSMLSNRDDLYMKFEYIRKTLVTTNKPLKATIKDENDEIVDLWVDVRDTMLLLPEGYKSLEKASTFIEGYEKIDLSDEVKSNMYQFLQDEPKLFEKYAIRDAEVTLKLFIKLEFLLNQINGTNDKLFSTLASATTNDFKKFSRSKFDEIKLESVVDSDGKIDAGKLVHNMQFDRFHSLYKKYESLADRSYSGGLNSSYHMGYCEGYTFIDIDFKNAYPTAMNLLKVGNFGEKLVRTKKIKKDVNLEGLSND